MIFDNKSCLDPAAFAFEKQSFSLYKFLKKEQSKAKMDKYIHASQTKLLSDVMTAGFEENDSCFINWEKLTKKGNNALKDSERTNFLEHIQHALNQGLRFVIIVDESHQNNTSISARIKSSVALQRRKASQKRK